MYNIVNNYHQFVVQCTMVMHFLAIHIGELQNECKPSNFFYFLKLKFFTLTKIIDFNAL